MKKFALSLALMLSAFFCHAQNNIVDNHNALRKYLLQKEFTIDTAASAVILYEKGIADLSDGNLIYKTERVIKVLEQGAIDDLSIVIIPCGKDAYITNVLGTIYNLEDSNVKQQKVTYPDMSKNKAGQNRSALKLALPSVKEGSIIHYTFTATTSGTLFTPEWYFQSPYPCLYSTFEVVMPKYMQYTALERIKLPINRVTTPEETEQCENCSWWGTAHNLSIPVTSTAPLIGIWTRRNIPALPQEPYMESIDNYRERVRLHITAAIVSESRQDLGLFQHTSVLSESPQHIFENWEELTRKFFYNDNLGCGQVFNGNHYLKAITDSLLKGEKSSLEKAKIIYTYVRNNIGVTENENSAYSIKNVYENKLGNKTSVNLLLAAMLRKAGLDSEPLLLSTRDKERLTPQYADPAGVNYVAVLLAIGQKEYLLDASIKWLPFGMLSPECYNGYSRTVNKKGKAIILSPDSLYNKTTYMVSIVPDDQNKQKLKVNVDVQFGLLSSLYYRSKWSKDTTEIREKIIQDIDNNSNKSELESYSVKNIANPELPLSLNYVASINIGDTATTILIDPFFNKLIARNPFVSNSRIYPIELDSREDINYTLRLQLPKNYKLEDYPKSMLLKLDAKERMSLKNRVQYEESDNVFSMNTKLSINSTTYTPQEYTEVRSFYDLAFKEQHNKIVLRKHSFPTR